MRRCGTRVRALAAILLVGPLALAGCLGTETTTRDQDVGPTEATQAPPGPAFLATAAAWNGTLIVGALYELPAHFPETAPLVEPLWRDSMRTFEVTKLPANFTAEANFTVEMVWTGAPGSQVQLMVEAPPDNDSRVSLWTAPAPDEFTTNKHLCVSVPAAALATGYWQIMPHTLAGADIEFTVTARLVGGMGQYRAGHHGWMSVREWAVDTAEGNIQNHPADPCGP